MGILIFYCELRILEIIKKSIIKNGLTKGNLTFKKGYIMNIQTILTITSLLIATSGDGNPACTGVISSGIACLVLRSGLNICFIRRVIWSLSFVILSRQCLYIYQQKLLFSEIQFAFLLNIEDLADSFLVKFH